MAKVRKQDFHGFGCDQTCCESEAAVARWWELKKGRERVASCPWEQDEQWTPLQNSLPKVDKLLYKQ